MFSDRLVNPQKIVDAAAALIAFTGDEQALWEASKLIKIDEGRFGGIVENTLDSARGNPFTLCYLGLNIGDPAVEKRIMAWIDGRFAYEENYMRRKSFRSWAEAMVDRYNGVPTKTEMANDPISRRLLPAKYAALEIEMQRFTSDAASRKAK